MIGSIDCWTFGALMCQTLGQLEDPLEIYWAVQLCIQLLRWILISKKGVDLGKIYTVHPNENGGFGALDI